MSYDQIKECYKAQNSNYVNKDRVSFIVTCIQCSLGTLLSLSFKATFWFISSFWTQTNEILFLPRLALF
jgi:hypothetical protein